MPTLGEFDKSKTTGGPQIDGPFQGMISKAEIVLDPDGNPHVTDFGKHQVDVSVTIDGETTIRRRMSVSFGKMGNNFAALAELIQAAMGIPCGDPRQKKVQPSDLEGKLIRGLATVNERGYTDIIKWQPPKAGANAFAFGKKATIAVDGPGADEDPGRLDEDLPF